MRIRFLITTLLVVLPISNAVVKGKVGITGELKKWHRVTLTFDGPDTDEEASPNPFLDYRLNVFFTKGEKCFTVPGYYAADGDAGQTSATEGNKWHVHFVPNATGRWTYMVSFRTGPNIAVSTEPGAGEPGDFDGVTGTFDVIDTDKSGRDFRASPHWSGVGVRHRRQQP